MPGALLLTIKIPTLYSLIKTKQNKHTIHCKQVISFISIIICILYSSSSTILFLFHNLEFSQLIYKVYINHPFFLSPRYYISLQFLDNTQHSSPAGLLILLVIHLHGPLYVSFLYYFHFNSHMHIIHSTNSIF